MKSRRSFVKETAMAATALMALRPLQSIAGNPSLFSAGKLPGDRLTILHTGDLRGYLAPVADADLYSGLGGFRELTAVIASVKEKYPHTLLVDAGHMDDEKSSTRSAELLAKAGKLRYDAVYVRRDAGMMTSAFSEYQLPVINSHFLMARDGARPWRIVQRGAYKVGILTAGAESGGLNPIQRANELAAELKQREGCNLVICLSTLGFDKNKKLSDVTLAERSEHIDIILGSGSRSFMTTPHVVANKRKQEVIINHTGFGGIVLGKLDVVFNERGEKQQVIFDNLMIGTRGNRWRRPTA